MPLSSGSANDTLNAAIVEQLDACLAQMAASGESSTERVHAARKGLKRVRALLALRRRQKHFARDRDALRSVARSLSRVRDAAAIAQTWSTGQELVAEPARSVIAEVLAQHRAQASPPDRESRRLARAGQVLSIVRARLALTLEHEPSEGPKQIERAARASYGRARRMLRRAIADPSTTSLHALRRAAKRHQYQLQFLEPLWQRPLEAQRKEVGRLTELLGAHRDLSTIEVLLEHDEPERLRALDDAWRAELQRWQSNLLTSALELARAALSDSARGFEERLHRLFAAQAHE
ncbi:MAG TPA: CHAD domain-containing protein [Polyangiaceae bacterium]|nr:CHAD domain-containing protein [Polyangiaceae bacterium]